MRVTDVRINLVHPDAFPLLCYASFTLDDCFAVRGVRVVQTRDGRRIVAMPDAPRKEGGHRDLAHPTNEEMRQHINDAILTALDQKRREAA